MRFELGVCLLTLATLSVGCTNEPTTDADPSDGEPSEVQTQGFHVKSPELLGLWTQEGGGHPTLTLQNDGRFLWNTGILCITTPCPSGGSGVWFEWKSWSGDRRVTLRGSDGVVAGHVYRFRASAQLTTLTGLGSTKESFVKAQPAGVPCGNAICGAGLVCCNPLAEICTPPGMMCIQ